MSLSRPLSKIDKKTATNVAQKKPRPGFVANTSQDNNSAGIENISGHVRS
jgi:hypothetical protein